ncbi:MAG: ribonuclease HII [Methylococcales bacterium]|nr:ribonuclease HII [Methylococcales bacterium]MCK5924981.1 ribonuclease HII [Methylococcales bacterium]
MQQIAGIDEVGRGCLVGAVIAAAVILDPKKPIQGLTDSKKITPKRRIILSQTIKRDALAWAIGRAEPSEIDRINILQASLLAMQRAFEALTIQVDWVKVDGNQYPLIDCRGEIIIKGDLTEPVISAASIIAKVHRDDEMKVLNGLYPQYEFLKHKGYATVLHRQRLQQFGITPLHRKSFAPVRRCIEST